MSDRDHPYQIASTTNATGFWGNLIGWAERPAHPAGTFRHSYIVLPDRIIEAAPGGVRENALDAWTGAGRTVYSGYKLNELERRELALYAHEQLRKPYDYLGDLIVGIDGLWLDLWKHHIPDDLFAIAEHLEDRAGGAWFCSALADAAMTWALQTAHPKAGVFHDGRPFHSVNPQELGERLIKLFPEVNDA